MAGRARAGETVALEYRFMPPRLRVHLVVLVLICLVPTLGLAVYVDRHYAQAILAAHQRYCLATAKMLATSVDSELERDLGILSGLARNIEVTRADGTLRVGANFQALLTQAAYVSDAPLVVRLPNGTPLLASISDAATAPLPASWPAIAAQASHTEAGVIGNVTRAEGSGMLIIPIITPVMRENEAVFFLEMLLPVDRLITLLRHIDADSAEDADSARLAMLLDARHAVVAASRNVTRLAGKPYQTDGDQAATHINLRTVANWQIVYQESQHEAFAPAYWGIPLTSLMATMVLLFGLAVALHVSRRLARWVRQLSALTGNVASGSAVPKPLSGTMMVAELEQLRLSMLRADAVLRRRAAAERMALREARTGHELLVSVVNGTAESIHVKDLELRYVMVNRAALTNPGGNGGPAWAEWQVLGRTTADLFPTILARRIDAADRRVLATGRMTSFEQEYFRPGESTSRWLGMTVAPWQNAEGTVVGVVSVSRDVTQSRRSEMRLRKLQAELLRVTRLSAMGAMSSGLAHELNQPLAAATNYLNAGSRLLERSSAGDANALLAARGAVADAAQQMLRAGAIVRRLRDFVERGEVELQPENIAELLRETCDLARTDGHTEGIALRCSVDDRIGNSLLDRTQIGQVLFNLIRNAAEAIQESQADPPQAGKPTGRIDVSAHFGLESAVWIEVTDNGPGLAPGIAERLFEPFVSTKRSGMGIGLAICRTIVEGHGGMLTALANPTGGMIFRISLPALLPQGVAA